MTLKANNIKRGDIFYAELDGNRGSEQGGVRPVLVIQNDIGNRHAPTVIVAPLTSRAKRSLPTHVTIPASSGGLPQDSTALLEQVRTVDKSRLSDYVGSICGNKMREADSAIMISFFGNTVPMVVA